MNIGEQASTGTLTCQTVNCKGTVKYATLDPPIQNLFLGAEDGQILIGSTGADPVLSTLTPGDGVEIANGSGSITVTSKVSNGTSTTDFSSASDGQVLIGSSGSDAVLSTLTAGTGVEIANGSGSITVSSKVSNGTSTTDFSSASDGQVLIGSSGSDAVLGTISPGDGLKVQNGSGSITVSADVLKGSTAGAYALYWNPTTKKFVHP
jgi:hypothetical protein